MTNQPTVEEYIKLLNDADATVRAQAIEKLAELDAKQAVEPLIEIVNSYREKESLRHEAMQAIGRIDGEGNIQFFIQRLLNTYRDTYWDLPSDLRLSITVSTILVSLGEIAVQPLIEALKSTDSDTRGGAAYTLGKIKDKRAITPLISLLLNDKDVSIRCQAAESLGEIGEAEALMALQEASQKDFGENVTYDFGTQTVSGVAIVAIEKIKSKGKE